MPSFEVSLPCPGSASRIVDRVVHFLCVHGYDVRRLEGSAAVLILQGGSLNAVLSRNFGHTLEVRADGAKLHARFEASQSQHLRPRELRLLMEEAADAAQAAANPKPPPTPTRPTPPSDDGESFRCRYCRKMTPTEAPFCVHCGAENFS